ncbi:hypothetical protein KVT40_004341 [Elsinoe batatas]|uniref:F-box domain-containing protein n=1 Tax=Elsinoe batatas TaxID=2601811 RepID=A0A8K0PIG5_9PEZI|nr:hypothetical protein KVT40_004341 [Elsinoe batatas]
MADPLTALPMELLHNVLDYLLPSHNQRFSPLAPGTPLLNLTLTSHALQSAVNAYSHLLLLRWTHIKAYRPLKTASLEAKRNSFSTLLRLTRTYCVFCGKKSSRKATLMNGLGCCATCDKKEWPDKVTRSDAKKKHGLKDKHLFMWGEDRPLEWPVVRYGSYVVMGSDCILLEKKGVERLAVAVREQAQRSWTPSQVRQQEAKGAGEGEDTGSREGEEGMERSRRPGTKSTVQC